VLSKTTSNFYVSIKTAEIPYSFFSLTTDFNVLVINIGGIDYNLTIPPGNYTAINIGTILTTLIQPYLINSTFVITYDRATGKNTITNTNYNLTPFNCKIKWNLNLELGSFFGYSLQTEIVGNGVTITYTNNISNIYVDCSQHQCLFLRSSVFSQPNNYEILYNNTWTNSSILQKIIITTPPNSIIFYQNELFNSVKISNKSISDIDFYLNSNKSTRIVDLNNLNFSFRLSIDEIDTISPIYNQPINMEPINNEKTQESTNGPAINAPLDEIENKLRNEILGTEKTQESTNGPAINAPLDDLENQLRQDILNA